MILLIDRNSNATWLMTLPLPAVTPKTVAKLTQNSGKQKVLIDFFWFLTVAAFFNKISEIEKWRTRKCSPFSFYSAIFSSNYCLLKNVLFDNYFLSILNVNTFRKIFSCYIFSVYRINGMISIIFIRCFSFNG